MQMRRSVRASLFIVGVVLAAEPSSAAFHLMQIEQVIGGVNGDPTAQAIQLRLRAGGETNLSFARLRAWDAEGANPITLIDFDTGVPSGSLGDRVLITSPAFLTYTQTSISSDFEMTSLIPDSYLAAGRITFEGDGGRIYWLLGFGGSAYVGSTLGTRTNDRDGDFGPPFAGPLPSSDLRALLFQGLATDFSLSNDVDYALTEGPAVFTNNAGESTLLVPEPGTLSLLLVAVGVFSRHRARRKQTR